MLNSRYWNVYYLELSPQCVRIIPVIYVEEKSGINKNELKRVSDEMPMWEGGDRACCNNYLSRPSDLKSKSNVSCDELGQNGLKLANISLASDGYLMSYFLNCLQQSYVLRTRLLTHVKKSKNLPIEQDKVILSYTFLPSEKDDIDMRWSGMLLTALGEKRDLDFALSWLSTLGGAFSALGDLSSSWALEAGRISFKQFRIALKLGDPQIASRCRLYWAISLLQQRRFVEARDIVQLEYNLLKTLPMDYDPRLRKMCLGIWCKLQYHWKNRRKLAFTMRNNVLPDSLEKFRQRNIT